MKEQEKLKSTVLKLYSAGSKVNDIVTQTGAPQARYIIGSKMKHPKNHHL